MSCATAAALTERGVCVAIGQLLSKTIFYGAPATADGRGGGAVGHRVGGAGAADRDRLNVLRLV